MQMYVRILTVCLCVLTAFHAQAQVSDTKRTTNSTLLGKLQNASIFDRTSRWELGGNWGCFSSRTADSLLGMSLNDNSIGGIGSVSWGILGEMDRFTEPLRLIPIHWALLFEQGFGIGTRIDPELAVSAGIVATESGVNSGAAHSFATGTAGTAFQKHRQFRKTDSSHIDTLSGNTNATVMSCDYNGNLSYTHISSTDTVSHSDPGQSGEMLWVGITLRRYGSVDAGDGSEPVLKLIVRRQRLQKPLDSIRANKWQYCPDTTVYDEDEDDLSDPPQALAFSFVPDTSISADNLAVIGTDTLPRLTRAIDSIVFNTPTTVNRLETELRHATRNPSWSGAAKEDVWKHYKDMRSTSGTDAYELVITRRMLNALNTSGSNSAWTDFDGLMVLTRPAPESGADNRSPFVRELL